MVNMAGAEVQESYYFTPAVIAYIIIDADDNKAIRSSRCGWKSDISDVTSQTNKPEFCCLVGFVPTQNGNCCIAHLDRKANE